jgi:hypothetical protein
VLEFADQFTDGIRTEFFQEMIGQFLSACHITPFDQLHGGVAVAAGDEDPSAGNFPSESVDGGGVGPGSEDVLLVRNPVMDVSYSIRDG